MISFKIKFILLLPVAILYSLIISVRNFFYNFGIFKISKFDIPVISVGNITAGGTGKTPLTAFLAELLVKNGLKPIIISRGYGRQSKGMVIVHDGKTIRADVKQAGDEPLMLARKLKNIPVICEKNRRLGIKTALDNFSADIILLDDAFQHRSVHRDLDIMLVNSQEPPDNYFILPIGRLREPLYNLNRADLIIYTKSGKKQTLEISPSINKYSNAPKIKSSMRTQLYRVDSGQFILVESIDEPVYAFCGIANPQSFKRECMIHAVTPADWRFFMDHQQYDQTILNQINSAMKQHDLESIVTTEKDLVKLPDDFLKNKNVYILSIDTIIDEYGLDELNKILNSITSYRRN